MPMSSDTDIKNQIQETAEDAVAKDGQFVPGVESTNIDSTDEFGDVEYYMWNQYYTKNKSISSIRNIQSSIIKLEEFIQQSNKVDCDIDDMDDSAAKRYKWWLMNEGEVEDSTAVDYISHLDNMAQFYRSTGYYPGNPFQGLTDGMDKNDGDNSYSYQTNDRISVDNSELRKAIRSTHGSQRIVLLSMLVKTGIRISEACNLDWKDINLNHPLADDILPDPRFELSDDPDTIYIDSDKTDTTTDVDTYGNKRKVDSWIAIDDELKRLLLWHALVREKRYDGNHPVFMVHNSPKHKSSERLGTNTAWLRVKRVAERYGWHGSSSEKQNVTPHWFRSKGSSYLKNRLEADDDIDVNPKAVVKGIRGDKGDDVIEVYMLREESFKSLVRSKMFKIGLEGM